MRMLMSRFELFVLHLVMAIAIVEAAHLRRPFNNSIPAIFVFGDSTVDSGNNNHIRTIFKSNFPPYGKDFPGHTPTGRFTDGRLVTDYIASYIGIKKYVAPYLDPKVDVDEQLTGVCFASAGSGFDPLTPQLLGVISIPKQLENFKEYKAKIEKAIGKKKTQRLIREAAYVISAGTNDLVINYYGTSFRRLTYDIDSYKMFLLKNVKHFIQSLRKEGAEHIAVVGLPPIGCVPIVITLKGNPLGRRPCVDSLSSIARDYNHKLRRVLKSLKITYADIYHPLNNMISNASHFGFSNVNAGCCGSGLLETSFICNPLSPVCKNASKYLFFDSVHPSQATYQFLFKALRPTIDHVIHKTLNH